MSQPQPVTSWSLLKGAAAGSNEARAEFAARYEQPIRRYLERRWAGRPALRNLEDAVQDAFVECFKPSGVLHRIEVDRGTFRALLYGMVRNVARRYEERAAHSFRRAGSEAGAVELMPAETEGLSRRFDRAWARAILSRAARTHEEAAHAAGDEALRRQQVLRMRHDDGLPIRDIAQLLGVEDVAAVHNDYRRARREFTTHLKDAMRADTGKTGEALDEQLRHLSELIAGS